MKLNKKENLSKFEIKIIQLIAEEKTNKEIAQILNYSQRSIEYKLTQIFKKLKVSTRVGLIAKAYQKKILS